MADGISENPTGLQIAAGSTSGLGQFAVKEIGVNSYVPATTAFDPHEIFRTINKWRVLIVLSLIVCPLLALGASLLITALYSATSQIEITQETPRIIPGSENQQPIIVNNTQFLATQLGLLKSESLAERVVETLRLASDPVYADQDLDAKSRRESAVAKVRGQVTVATVRDSRLVDITAVTPDAQTSAKVANAYAEEFISSNLQREIDATGFARDLLGKRLESTKSKLEESERALVAYASRQGIVELGGNKEDGARQSLDASSLVALNESLADARAARIAAEAKLRTESGNTSASVINNPTIQALTAERAQAQAEYQEKLATFTPALPAMVALRERIRAFDRTIASTTSNIRGSIQAEYQGAVAREKALQTRVNGLRSDVLDLRNRSIQYTILQREVDQNRALYDALLQRFKEIGVSDNVSDNKISVVDRAKVQNTPVSPNLFMNVLVGLLIGSLVGFGGAFLIEFIDDTIKLPDDVANKLELTLLGVLPRVGSQERFAAQLEDPKSDLTEASYSLRSALQFATDHGVPRSVLVTSSRPNEGKSSVSLALATAFGRLGKRVLLLDADMRKPTFYVQDKKRQDAIGLSHLLVKQGRVEDAIHSTLLRNVSLMPAGPKVPSPAELLSSDAFGELLTQLYSSFDLIVVDGPPVLGLADGPLLASACEGTVIVIETAGVRRALAANTVARLRAADARVLGVVLNKFDPRRVGYGYGYGYGYSYSYSYGGATAGDDDRKIAITE